jgi:hypothetical protein
MRQRNHSNKLITFTFQFEWELSVQKIFNQPGNLYLGFYAEHIGHGLSAALRP